MTCEIMNDKQKESEPDLEALRAEYLHLRRWGHARSYDQGKVQCNMCNGWCAPAMLDRLGMCGECAREFNE